MRLFAEYLFIRADATMIDRRIEQYYNILCGRKRNIRVRSASVAGFSEFENSKTQSDISPRTQYVRGSDLSRFVAQIILRSRYIRK